MKFVSIIGLLTLLAIAWAMSYHKKNVNLRTILWGLGLQFDFALIILQKDMWSFVGMALLGILLILYIFRDTLFEPSANYKKLAIYIPTLILVGVIAYFILTVLSFTWVLIFIILASISTRQRLTGPPMNRQ